MLDIWCYLFEGCGQDSAFSSAVGLLNVQVQRWSLTYISIPDFVLSCYSCNSPQAAHFTHI